MRVDFILPRSTNVPMGGYKVVFQYANWFAENTGDNVHIYFVINASKFSFRGIRAFTTGLIKKEKYRSISWFNISKRITLHFDVFPEDIAKKVTSNRSKVIATHWSTATMVSDLKTSARDKFYFIQDYEIFDPSATKEQVDETWHLDLNKIVVSHWLEKLGREMDVPTNYVPNFIDFDEFPIKTFQATKRYRITMLWHSNPRKQSALGLRILHRIHEEFPNMQMTVFGLNLPEGIPAYIETFSNATSAQLSEMIFSESLVYFMPSKKEGWGLTGMEAMASGAPVVAIDNGGIWEFAENGVSAMIVPNDEEQLYDAILSVMKNQELQYKLSANGNEVGRRFSLEKSANKFRNILKGDTDGI